METFCKIRDLYRAIADFENRFEARYGIRLNEGMLLCCLSEEERLSSGEIADRMGLTPSNTSKIIRQCENKNRIRRLLGENDHRQMYFTLTPEGRQALQNLKCNRIEIPELLQNVLNGTT